MWIFVNMVFVLEMVSVKIWKNFWVIFVYYVYWVFMEMDKNV